ncbi:pyruvate kinase [Streptomyces sp. P38-E01]|uniref:Pyruvate kinase n=1 Tax=Streptomyces tardus TaxID=2780544 RepID=A0A949JHM0_9ACTN|nr:pyruvate kinase [Streptomyces tardus]MBU7599622.1 pyruvate kinase [Streptomyces tardus]
MRGAKIVCTLGPATDSYEQIRLLVEAGLDVARFNLAHGTLADHHTRYRHLRAAAAEVGRTVGTLADLQGPRIRLTTFDSGPVLLDADDEFTITTEETRGDHTHCGTTHHTLHEDVSAGDRVLVDGGRVVLDVTAVEGPRIRTRVVTGGIVSDHKPLNLPGVALSVPAMTKKDADDLRWALGAGFDLVAMPHVRRAQDVRAVHTVMDEAGVRRPVLAKIEKPEAVQNLEEVLAAFDGLLIARGDLGVEMPLEAVPAVQKRLVALARRNAKPVIVATQMLESMVDNSRPTRAEASDVANAVMDGSDAVMLSAETSIGKYPAEAVATMSRIVAATEADQLAHGLAPLTAESKPRTHGGAVARAAAEIGDFLGARCLVAFTKSGDTAQRLARYRSPIPVLAFTPDPATHGQLCLTWGVEAFLGPEVATTDEMVQQVDEQLLRIGRCEAGDTIVITAGSPPGVSGTTNLVRVHHLGEPHSAGEAD